MVPLDCLQVRARSGIGKNDLPGRPGPQGPPNPLELTEPPAGTPAPRSPGARQR